MTTETKVMHTPGPWDDASKYPSIPTVRIFAGTHYIASVGNSDDTREQTAANARLIAAAPDLLATLKVFVALYDGTRDILGSAVRAKLAAADAAIAKAEGQ